MKRWDAGLLKGFLLGSPIVILYAAFSYSIDWKVAENSAGYLKFFYDLGGLVFGVWMILAVFLSVRLIVSAKFRETVLVKLTFTPERDERETLLVGKAAKATLLTSIALLILLFSLSCFQVSLYHLPPGQAVDGKTKAITLGVKLNLLEEASSPPEESRQNRNIVSYTGLPVSSSCVILGLLIWQIAFYNYSMRRLMK